MPRTHARIALEIWEDKDFIVLPRDAQWLYMSLISQSNINWCGVIMLTTKRWADLAEGTTVADITKAIECLAERRFVLVDERTEELLVRSFMRRDNILSSANTFKNAMTQTMHTRSPALRAELLIELRRLDVDKIANMKATHKGGELPKITYDRAVATLAADVKIDPKIDIMAETVGPTLDQSFAQSFDQSLDPSGHPVLAAQGTNASPESLTKALPERLTRGEGEGVGVRSSSSVVDVESSFGEDQVSPKIDTTRRPAAKTATTKANGTTPGATLANAWATADRSIGGKPIPSAVMAGIARQLDALMGDGLSERQLLVALDLWRAAGYGPSKLPDFANDVISGPDALILDPDRVLSIAEILDVRGGIIPAPRPDGWLDEARAHADRLRARGRKRIIDAKRGRR